MQKRGGRRQEVAVARVGHGARTPNAVVGANDGLNATQANPLVVDHVRRWRELMAPMSNGRRGSRHGDGLVRGRIVHNGRVVSGAACHIKS